VNKESQNAASLDGTGPLDSRREASCKTTKLESPTPIFIDVLISVPLV
jgi:hypothetical protein